MKYLHYMCIERRQPTIIIENGKQWKKCLCNLQLCMFEQVQYFYRNRTSDDMYLTKL